MSNKQEPRKKKSQQLIRNIDFFQKDIYYFLTLADLGNISKAAERLGIQQSGLSRSLKRLESDCGTTLFTRRNNGIVLTPFGESLLLAVEEAKESWELNLSRIQNESEVPAGIIRIAFHNSFGQRLFPIVASEISKLFPLVEVEIALASSHQVIRMVNTQEVDIGFAISPVKAPELIKKTVGNDYLAGFSRSSLQSFSHVLINPEMQATLPIMKKFGHLKRITATDYDLLAQMCLKGEFLAVLPHSVAQKYTQLKQIGGAFLKADISCVTHRERLKNRLVKSVFDISCKIQFT